MIRAPEPSDRPFLLSLAEATGIFQPGEVDLLLGSVLSAHANGELGEGHHVFLWADEKSNRPLGWAYLAASDKAPGVWDLWWIGVHPQSHQNGIGRRLLEAAENIVRDANGRVLVIETNTTPPLEAARRFYRQRGYRECGTIPDFYASNEGKVTFAKTF
jgi:ribosomal protein S18 acetylase RimI-like enzyme